MNEQWKQVANLISLTANLTLTNLNKSLPVAKIREHINNNVELYGYVPKEVVEHIIDVVLTTSHALKENK